MLAQSTRPACCAFDPRKIVAVEAAVPRKPALAFRAQIGGLLMGAVAIGPCRGAPMIGGVGRQIRNQRLREVERVTVRCNGPFQVGAGGPPVAVARRMLEQRVLLDL